MASRRRRVLGSQIWRVLRRLLGIRGDPPPPVDPPDDQPSLVPVGPPRHPRPAGSVALELPEEPGSTDARATESDED